MPLDMMDNSIKPLANAFRADFLLVRPHYNILHPSGSRVKPALTCTKPPITISRVSSHFIHARTMPNYPPPGGQCPWGTEHSVHEGTSTAST